MLFCAPKLVWDLLSRSSARPSVRSNRVSLHPFASLSVRYSVLHLSVSFSVNPSIPPFFHPSVFPSVSSVRPLARPPVLLPSTLLSVYLFVRSFPFLRPRFTICPSVHPVRRCDLSFWPSVCPSVCLSVFPNTYAFVLSFVRSSNHLSIYNGSW